MIITKDTKIRNALKIIGSGSAKCAIVMDNNKFKGILNDGDIRRAYLKGAKLDDTIENYFCKNPTVANISNNSEEIISKCLSNNIHQIPIIDNDGFFIELRQLDKLLINKTCEKKVTKVVLMLGGLGSRLSPMTDKTPKPMLKVGGKPILHTIVERFSISGYTNIVMCLGYKAQDIKDYFGNGHNFGVNIEYIVEEKRLGTAGALSLMDDKTRPKNPFFVMNGDLLTNINFENLNNFHKEYGAMATMCTREYDISIPYGVVNINNEKIVQINEKPTHNFNVNAGIYMLDHTIFDLIPNNKYYEMTDLFESLLKTGENVISFPIKEYWIDIGVLDEYKRANDDYHKVF